MTPELRKKIEEAAKRRAYELHGSPHKYTEETFIYGAEFALSLKSEPKALRYLRAKCATCGHKKGQHIYGDGGCRPGFKCQWNCERFVPYPAKSEPKSMGAGLCDCKPPIGVHNGVCGGCLRPLDRTPRRENGELVRRTHPADPEPKALGECAMITCRVCKELTVCPDERCVKANHAASELSDHTWACSVECWYKFADAKDARAHPAEPESGSEGEDERDAKIHAEPHYESDESTWGAIDYSAFLAGSSNVRKQIPALIEEAVRAERERCAAVVREFYAAFGKTYVVEQILNPTPEAKDA